MTGWIEFTLALVAFLASHLVPIRLSGPLTAAFGRRAYLIGFSALSLALLYWLILAAGRAPHVELWPQAGWMRWLVFISMPLAFLLGATAGLAGIFAGFTLWAGAHLIANGDLAHVIFFGTLLLYAFAGLLRARPDFALKPTLPRVALGVGLWAVVLHLHELIIGVSPLP